MTSSRNSRLSWWLTAVAGGCVCFVSGFPMLFLLTQIQHLRGGLEVVVGKIEEEAGYYFAKVTYTGLCIERYDGACALPLPCYGPRRRGTG